MSRNYLWPGCCHFVLKFVFFTYNKINFSCTNYDIIGIKLTEVFRLTA